MFSYSKYRDQHPRSGGSWDPNQIVLICIPEGSKTIVSRNAAIVGSVRGYQAIDELSAVSSAVQVKWRSYTNNINYDFERREWG